jgi:WD40 repeat protein
MAAKQSSWESRLAYCHDDTVNGAALTNDEKRILSWSKDNTLRLWDVATGQQVGPAMKHDDAVNGALLTKDGTRILSWSDDASLRLWDIATRRQIVNIGATFTFKDPPGGKMHGHVDARDPVTGKVAWSVDYPEPPLASLLSTAGGLVFVPDTRGWLHALDAKTGKELWKANDGNVHNGGIISYEANGKQYIATVTGFPSMVSDGYADWFGGPYKYMEKDTGVLIAYAVDDT